MYIVFECRKCGHELYMDSYNIDWKHFKKLAEEDCPQCGEEGYENWILLGTSRTFPGDDIDAEDE